jgi:hypothetical protein
VASLWGAPGAFAAGWCGNDATGNDRPDVVTGQQVHAVVALPADAPDTFAADAARLADDITSADQWWRAQDPTRAPRWDQAVFPAGRCVDISFVRLSDPASAYAGIGSSAAYQHLGEALETAGLGNAYKKYLVYFDGPAAAEDICGTGGGDFRRGPSYAVVWLLGCPGVPNDAVATHELLHALGALPTGAPHACALAQGGPGHPCDSEQDIIYPFTSGDPLSALVLDVNHDDYYGHTGSWDDIQDSFWLEHLNTPKQALTVSLSGVGEIESDVPGVACATECTTQWDQSAVLSLTALPAKTDRFVRWTGSCTGNGDCALELDQPASATAVFGPLRIPVRATTAGHGTIACSPKCTKSFTAGNTLSLRAVAAKGWKFTGWTGGCKGTRVTCSPATDFALNVRATFRRR